MIGVHAGLDPLRDFNLRFCAEQWELGNLLQVEANEVVGIRYLSKHLGQFALVIHFLEKDKRLRGEVGRFRHFDRAWFADIRFRKTGAHGKIWRRVAAGRLIRPRDRRVGEFLLFGCGSSQEFSQLADLTFVEVADATGCGKHRTELLFPVS